jgi:hypothetical protein
MANMMGTFWAVRFPVLERGFSPTSGLARVTVKSILILLGFEWRVRAWRFYGNDIPRKKQNHWVHPG